MKVKILNILKLYYSSSSIINFLRVFYVKYSMPITIHENKNAQGNVLICYIKSPFKYINRPIKHCNVIESRIIAETFNNLGYSVDVVDYRCKRKIDYSKYSIIFGFGDSYRNSFNNNLDIKRICYMTGSNPNFSNKQEALRIKNFYKNKNILLQPRREAYWPWMHTVINSDYLITTGNIFTRDTYIDIQNNTFHIPVPFIPTSINFEASFSRGFLWFGGAGAIFKGLDLVIDAINDSTDSINLDICGPIKDEKDFMETYKQDIIENENINFHEMIDVNSSKMKVLVERNSFIILPSCSEGGASSVLTCMNMGLIPIVTKECSIDLNGFGLKINELSKEEVLVSINKALLMTDQEIASQKLIIKDFVKKNHSVEAIESKVYKLMNKLLTN
jgi:glycosyltransferase involved in cell wall biosynthesis